MDCVELDSLSADYIVITLKYILQKHKFYLQKVKALVIHNASVLVEIDNGLTICENKTGSTTYDFNTLC